MNSASIARGLFLGLALNSFSVATPAQSSLPKEVRSDILRQQLTAAYDAGDYAQLLVLIDEFKEVTHAENGQTPTSLFFVEAQAAAATNDFPRALARLSIYLRDARKDDPHYSEAIQLYPSVRAAADKQLGGVVELVARVAGTYSVGYVPGTYRPERDSCGRAGRQVTGKLWIDDDAWRRFPIDGDMSGSRARLTLSSDLSGDQYAYPAMSCSVEVEVGARSPASMTLRVLKLKPEQQNGYWCEVPNTAEVIVGDGELKLRGDFFDPGVCPRGNDWLIFRRR